MNNDVRTRREKGKNVNYAIDSKGNIKAGDLAKKEKKVTVPEYHFYDNKDVLIELMQKEEDYETNKNSADAENYPSLT